MSFESICLEMSPSVCSESGVAKSAIKGISGVAKPQIHHWIDPLDKSVRVLSQFVSKSSPNVCSKSGVAKSAIKGISGVAKPQNHHWIDPVHKSV